MTIEESLADATDKMEKAIGHLKEDLSGIRTGRATAAVLNRVTVEYYGTLVPLNQLASITVPEPRLLAVSPFDKGSVSAIEKAIQSSDLGINPSNDGRLIRLPIPLLTEQRRRDLVKQVHQRAEEARVAVRNVRRHAVDELRKQLRAGEVAEDDERHAQEEIEKMTHTHTERIDELSRKKEQELMDV